MDRNRSRAKQRTLTDDTKDSPRSFDDIGERLGQGETANEEIDGVISMLGEIDVDSVESLADAGLSKEAEEKDGEWVEEEREERSSSFAEDTSDPVRMYLQEIGAVSLLSREQEVEIAKQIEEGEKQVREHVLNHPFVLTYLLDIADRIKAGELTERELLDEEAEDGLPGGGGWRGRRRGHGRYHLEDVGEASQAGSRAYPGGRSDAQAAQGAEPATGTQDEQRAATPAAQVLDELQLGRRHITAVVDKLKKAERFLAQQQQIIDNYERRSKQSAAQILAWPASCGRTMAEPPPSVAASR